jgi:hypothetical protein
VHEASFFHPPTTLFKMSYCNILDLPNELLYYTLEICHPDDFESSVLTCRRFHEVAKPLIPNYNICRQLALDSDLEFTSTGHIVIRDPSDFLLWLSQKPTKVQVEVFRYFKRVILFPSHARLGHDTNNRGLGEMNHLDIVEKKLQECPALNRAVSDALPGPKDADGILQCYEYALLILFSHAESLILPHGDSWLNHKRHGHSQFPGLPELAWQDQGTEHLQHLRELYVHGTAKKSLHATIAPLLGLPKLEMLVLGEFDQRKSIPPEFLGICYNGYRELSTKRDLKFEEVNETEDSLDKTSERLKSLAGEVQYSNIYGDRCSALKKLVIHRGSWHAEDMGKLLRHVPSLRTLIWEDYTQLPANRFSDIQAEVTPELWFKPLNMLQQLASTHGDKLEHLALMINEDGESAFIARDQAIVDFKDFVQLKHLEIDVRILKLAEDWESPPPSLTGALPRNLQNLGLVIPNPDRRTVDGFLGSLPGSKTDFPSLQKIVLSVPLRGSYDRFEVNSLRTLVRKFAEVNVTLISKEYYTRQRATFDWGGHTNFLDHIDERFYELHD